MRAVEQDTAGDVQDQVAFQPGRRIVLANRGFALWPRTEDCLSAASAEEAPVYELREGGLSVVR